MIRLFTLFCFLLFSFPSFSRSSFDLDQKLKGGQVLAKSFLIAEAGDDDDEFGEDDLDDIEDVGEGEEEEEGSDDLSDELDGEPSLEDRDDYELIDEDLKEEEEEEEKEEKKEEEEENGEWDTDEMEMELDEDEEALEKELDTPEPDETDIPSDADPDADSIEFEPAAPPEDSFPEEGTDPIDDGTDFNIDGDDDMAPEGELGGGDLNLITNIRYISSSNTVVIDGTKTPSFLQRKNKKNHQLIIEILQSRLMDNLEWPYPLKDFKTDFGLIQADQKDDETVRIVFQLKKGAPFPSTKIGEKENQVIVGFGGLSEVPALAGTGKGPDRMFKGRLPAKTLEEFYYNDLDFSGSPISFHVIDAPVKQVLHFISEESRLNMVIGDGVSGTIDLKLEDVPWDQAFHIVVTEKNLGYRKQGNVVIVSTLKSIEDRAKKLREIVERKQPLIPFKTEVIPLAYEKPSNMRAKVSDFLTKANAVRKQEAGRIIVHEETNTFIVIDTEKAIEKIKKVVKQLDRPPKQVMIEARIVEADETFSKSFGLRWTVDRSLPASVSVDGILDFVKGNFFGGLEINKNSEGGADVDLNIGQIPIIGDIEAALNLAEGEGYARIVSTPKVVAISGKTATITRNSPIVFLTSALQYQPPTGGEGGAAGGAPGDAGGLSPGAAQRQYGNITTVDVSINLSVTPVITSQGSVFLTVQINRESAGGSKVESGGTLKISRSANTEVLVQNGHTVVIGGIYQYDQTSDRKGVPFFSKIPLLSWLFDSVSSSYAKNELLVFLTPKILDSNE
ncbi:MAG: hypothetical protein OXB86_01785 [Bdellovibrionales bacterium]|nr:hypothetical protein [Bdellovibrionales bacterium]